MKYKIIRETHFPEYDTKDKKQATKAITRLNKEERVKAKKMKWELIDKWVIFGQRK